MALPTPFEIFGVRRQGTTLWVHYQFMARLGSAFEPFGKDSDFCRLQHQSKTPFMKIELVRVNDAFHFEGSGSSEIKVHVDGSPEIGGQNAGVRPMELLLMGLASCSAIDMVLIMKKQRQEITDFRIVAEGDREQEKGTLRKPYNSINLHFILKGNNLDTDKVERALQLSMEKYCSATAQFEGSANITHSVTVERNV